MCGCVCVEKCPLQKIGFVPSGESQYRARVEDIRILKLEIKKLRRERGLLRKSISTVDELKFVLS